MTPPPDAAPLSAATLVLADSRLPAGGHAHSAGLEWAARHGRVADVDGLERYLRGRLSTVALVDAAFAAAACSAVTAATADGPPDAWRGSLAVLDVEYQARVISPTLRAVSRTLGRHLARSAARIWPGAVTAHLAAWDGGPHHAVAFGAVSGAAGTTPRDAATAAAYATVAAPASAAVRLLGLDPVAVHALLARFAAPLDDVAARACRSAGTAEPAALPALGAVRTELAAEDHAIWEVRLFAS